MVATDEDLLICDLAEIYHVYNYRALPLLTVATLCTGMGAKSRVLAKMSGLKVPVETYMRAYELDLLELLVWQNTEDGHKGNNQPNPRTANLRIEEHNEEVFDCPEDFEAFRPSIFTPERGEISG